MEVITSLVIVFLVAMVTNNIVLSTGYGICSYIGVSKNRKSAIGMGCALVFVVFMASLVSYFLEMLLVALNIEFMQTIVFILVIASLVQLVEMICKKFLPSLYQSLGIYLPLITTNCVVLYVTKQICDVEAILIAAGVSGSLANNGFFNFLFAMVYALGTALGYFLCITLMSTIRNRIDYSPVKRGFAGAGIALVTTAIMVLAIGGLSGIF